MYFAGKLVYLIVLASVQLAVMAINGFYNLLYICYHSHTLCSHSATSLQSKFLTIAEESQLGFCSLLMTVCNWATDWGLVSGLMVS